MNFNESVWKFIKKIPKGKVATYKEIARAIGNVNAFRAVGNACNKNPHSPKVPCHRIVASDGKIGGYAFGEKKKILLLKKEGVAVSNGKIVDFENVLYKFD